MNLTQIFSRFLSLLLILLFTGHGAKAQKIPANIAGKIHFRSIGPTRQGGRYVDFAVVNKATKVIYAATASGGLWKTVNNGISWKPVFDHENIISMGAVAVDQQDTSVVWVGTGEANNSRSSYWGHGIYKSTDGGQSWKNMGLPKSGHIGRILVDSQNTNTVYVAALGHLYSENEERGLYKTTDGGRTWKKVLEVKRDDGKYIGVADVAISPADPNTLIAAAYDKIRRPWTFNEGGHGSGIYKSTNGGQSWTKLEGGLPGGFLGRIGLAYAPGNAQVVYANIENVNIPGIPFEERKRMLEIGIPPKTDQEVAGTEMWRSDDGGISWKKISPEGEDVGGYPAYYYQQVRADPNDKDHAYVLGIRVWETTDGGKSWHRPFTFGGDNHALWIDPADSKHMILGYDHGMGITYDGGKNWYHPDEKPLAQCYTVEVDMAHPYHVYSGLQDNGSVRGPSTTRTGEPIRMEHWQRTGGGDGMYNVPDRSDNRHLYNESQFGNITRLDMQTGQSKSLVSKLHSELRWNWNAPIVVSQHNTDVVYHAGNKVLKSGYRGEGWEAISDDLTTRDSVKIMGTGNIQYCTITALEESPVNKDVLWAGTDDGNVQLTRDGGLRWTLLNDNIPDNPGYWVSRIEASAHHEGTAYLTYTGYRRDDFRPFVYKTTDFGKTWTSLARGLPHEPVNVIREDHKNPDLLFLGTEMSVYASVDGGQNWRRLTNGLPTNPVHDMVIHPRENELVVGTHGRGIFIADIKPLQELTVEVIKKAAHLFEIQPAVQWLPGMSHHAAFTNYQGESRTPGVHLFFYAQAAGKAKIKIYQGTREIYKFDLNAEAGLNHQVWAMNKVVKKRSKKDLEEMRSRLQNQGLPVTELKARMAEAQYITAPVGPGDYTVQFEMAGVKMTRKASVFSGQ